MWGLKLPTALKQPERKKVPSSSIPGFSKWFAKEMYTETEMMKVAVERVGICFTEQNEWINRVMGDFSILEKADDGEKRVHVGIRANDEVQHIQQHAIGHENRKKDVEEKIRKVADNIKEQLGRRTPPDYSSKKAITNTSNGDNAVKEAKRNIERFDARKSTARFNVKGTNVKETNVKDTEENRTNAKQQNVKQQKAKQSSVIQPKIPEEIVQKRTRRQKEQTGKKFDNDKNNAHSPLETITKAEPRPATSADGTAYKKPAEPPKLQEEFLKKVKKEDRLSDRLENLTSSSFSSLHPAPSSSSPKRSSLRSSPFESGGSNRVSNTTGATTTKEGKDAAFGEGRGSKVPENAEADEGGGSESDSSFEAISKTIRKSVAAKKTLENSRSEGIQHRKEAETQLIGEAEIHREREEGQHKKAAEIHRERQESRREKEKKEKIPTEAAEIHREHEENKEVHTEKKDRETKNKINDLKRRRQKALKESEWERKLFQEEDKRDKEQIKEISHLIEEDSDDLLLSDLDDDVALGKLEKIELSDIRIPLKSAEESSNMPKSSKKGVTPLNSHSPIKFAKMPSRSPLKVRSVKRKSSRKTMNGKKSNGTPFSRGSRKRTTAIRSPTSVPAKKRRAVGPDKRTTATFGASMVDTNDPSPFVDEDTALKSVERKSDWKDSKFTLGVPPPVYVPEALRAENDEPTIRIGRSRLTMRSRRLAEQRNERKEGSEGDAGSVRDMEREAERDVDRNAGSVRDLERDVDRDLERDAESVANSYPIDSDINSTSGAGKTAKFSRERVQTAEKNDGDGIGEKLEHHTGSTNSTKDRISPIGRPQFQRHVYSSKKKRKDLAELENEQIQRIQTKKIPLTEQSLKPPMLDAGLAGRKSMSASFKKKKEMLLHMHMERKLRRERQILAEKSQKVAEIHAEVNRKTTERAFLGNVASGDVRMNGKQGEKRRSEGRRGEGQRGERTTNERTKSERTTNERTKSERTKNEYQKSYENDLLGKIKSEPIEDPNLVPVVDDTSRLSTQYVAQWASVPKLKSQLLKQSKINPARIFGQVAKVDCSEIFGRRYYGSLNVQWQGEDGLSAREMDAYDRKMGWKQ